MTHERYLLEFANVADDGEPEPVRAVLTDPDRVLAEPAVVRHLDLRAITRGEDGRESEPTSASDRLPLRAREGV